MKGCWIRRSRHRLVTVIRIYCYTYNILVVWPSRKRPSSLGLTSMSAAEWKGGVKAFTCICLLCSLIVDISRMLQDHGLHRHRTGVRQRDHNIATSRVCVYCTISVHPAPRNYPDEIFDLALVWWLWRDML